MISHPAPSFEGITTAILTPIKKCIAIFDPPSLAQPLDVLLPPSDPTTPIEMRALETAVDQTLGAKPNDHCSNKEELFEDATNFWVRVKEDKGEEPEFPKQRMSSLLESIDRLVEKEKSIDKLLDEDRQACANDKNELESHIHSSRRFIKKADLSPSVGFHIVLDSQATPSRPLGKKSRGDPRGIPQPIESQKSDTSPTGRGT